jgi:hypothetical protein
VSPTDVWAVGVHTVNVDQARSLIEHWDGVAWSVVKTRVPPAGTQNNLLSVVADAGDRLGLGVRYPSDIHSQALALQSTGGAFRPTHTPDPPIGTFFEDAAMVDAFDVWAVGAYSGHAVPLVEHWTGGRWQVIPTPDVGPDALFHGVAVRDGTLWAVGERAPGGNVQTLVESWDGSSWTVEDSPHPRDESYLLKVAAVPGSEQVWAVGSADAQAFIAARC